MEHVVRPAIGEIDEYRVSGQKARVKVMPDTRNHQGFFLTEEDETYTFVEETESGWAYICAMDADNCPVRCHLVNPADLQYLKKF